MASTLGAKVHLDGEKEFKSAITNINSSLKTMSTELKKVSSEYLSNNKSIDSYVSQNRVMQKSLDANKEKLKIQEEALVSAVQEYGTASKQAEAWRQSINRTQTEINTLNHKINQNEAAIEDANKPTEEMSENLKKVGGNAQDAGRQTLTLGDIIKANLISEGIVMGIKSLANAMKEVVTGVVDLGKKSISSYADYEQLIGGVETLFGDSAGVVEQYANNAYKTAGLSANEYMEGVTSFSASLLQSLNGDTAKAAKVADMAITDMSDNANKMGTDMASIQTAYQGFAKQNYTMLDNLKLGYGGTKSEMERLLQDATKITGTKYDLSNLSDVYDAIHVVQTELGITGTTALEASKTISGSVGSMKKAYTNLLTGFANGNADMGVLVGNLIDSVLTAVDNVLPAISQMMDGLVDGLYQAIPLLMEAIPQIIDALTTMISDHAVFIIDAGMNLLMSLIQGIIDNLPALINAALAIIVELAYSIGNYLPELIPTIIDAVLLIVETLIDNVDLLIDAAVQLTLGIADGLIKGMPLIIDKVPTIIVKLVDAFIRNAPVLISAGIELMLKLAGGIINGVPQLLGKIPGIISDIWYSFTNIDWGGVGRNIIQGIGNGLGSMGGWLVDQARNIASRAFNGIKSFFGINSPSRLMRDEIGKHLATGIGVGFESEMEKVETDMHDAIPMDFSLNPNVTANIQSNSMFEELISINKKILEKDNNMYVDGNRLVGATGSRYDNYMSSRLMLKERGVG